MKIALAQLNYTVGAIETNSRKIVDSARQARKLGADLIVYSEMAVTGYPPKDIVERQDFIAGNLKCLEWIASEAPENIGIICGYIDKNTQSGGKPLYNAAALIHEGRILSRHYKSLLPTYDVFDEARYFQPAGEISAVDFQGMRLGISVCEDIWNDKRFWRCQKYHSDPIEKLAGQKPELLISINASPFTVGKRDFRFDILSNTAARHHLPLIYVNQVGGNDSLIFDGCSAAFAPDGNRFARAKDFEEDLIIIDTKELSGPKHEIAGSDIEQIYRALLLGLRDYVHKCGFKSAVLGLSGGIDSSVTAALAGGALGSQNVLGVLMPSQFSSDHSITDAEALADNLRIKRKTIPIKSLFQTYLRDLEEHFKGMPPDITEENLQARIRGTILMAFSNKFGHLLLSTGNKSELSVGYCTLYGDMSGGLSVLSDVPKTIVYQLARYINRDREIIPADCLTKPPSAELRPDQRDVDSLPEYDILDRIVQAYVEEQKSISEIEATGIDRDTVFRVVEMIHQSEYKREQISLGLKITTKAFGYGRRMPVASRHEYLSDLR